jgi:outer membrane protein assembly factor BamB
VTGPGGARIEGLPFLTMLGLARAAAEGRARLAGQPVPAQAVFGAGLDLCLALRTRNPALASNPWLEALQGRCTTGLAALQAPVPDHAPASSASPRAPATLPLATAGQVRRLTLHARWSRPLALGEEGARLTLDRGRVVVASAHGLQAFSRRGEALLQRSGAQGLAARGLASLCATADRLLYFGDAGASASWVRDHDGTPLGQALELVDGVLVTTLAQRAAIGLDPVTGRELWRFAPPRTQRAWVSAAGARVLVATDGGVLHGLDAATGQLRFSVRASMPCTGPALTTGRRAVLVLRRADAAGVLVCDALARGDASPAGTVAWSTELALAAPGPAVTSRGRVYVTGHRGGQALVVAISGRGEVLWERPTPLEPASQLAVAFEQGLLVTDARGGAVRLLADGQPSWVLGGSADQLSRPVAPLLRRGVLVVTGPTVRLVDPTVGRLLAQIETGPHLGDVAVDARFTLYALREPGVLEAFEPGAVLSLVA